MFIDSTSAYSHIPMLAARRNERMRCLIVLLVVLTCLLTYNFNQSFEKISSGTGSSSVSFPVSSIFHKIFLKDPTSLHIDEVAEDQGLKFGECRVELWNNVTTEMILMRDYHQQWISLGLGQMVNWELNWEKTVERVSVQPWRRTTSSCFCIRLQRRSGCDNHGSEQIWVRKESWEHVRLPVPETQSIVDISIVTGSRSRILHSKPRCSHTRLLIVLVEQVPSSLGSQRAWVKKLWIQFQWRSEPSMVIHELFNHCIKLFSEPIHEVSVCVGPIYGNESRWLEIVETTEHHVLIGIRHFYITVFNEMDSYTRRLLDEYQR